VQKNSNGQHGMKNFLLTLWYRYKEWRFERKCLKHLGMKPTKMYVSTQDYDTLVKRLNEPPDPEAIKRFKEILNRKAPWDE
jgi:hypothetical protein